MSDSIRRRGVLLGGLLAMSLVAGGLMLFAGSEEARAGATVSKANLKGNGAYYNGYDGSAKKYYYVNVSKTDKDTVYMYYYVYTYAASTGYVFDVYGYGYIPDSAFSGSGDKVTLDVDTSKVTDFYFYAGSGGTVKLEWNKDGAYSYSRIANYMYSYGSVTQHQHSNSDQASATVSGEIHGTSSLPTGSAYITDSHTATVTHIH